MLGVIMEGWGDSVGVGDDNIGVRVNNVGVGVII